MDGQNMHICTFFPNFNTFELRGIPLTFSNAGRSHAKVGTLKMKEMYKMGGSYLKVNRIMMSLRDHE